MDHWRKVFDKAQVTYGTVPNPAMSSGTRSCGETASLFLLRMSGEC